MSSLTDLRRAAESIASDAPLLQTALLDISKDLSSLGLQVQQREADAGQLGGLVSRARGKLVHTLEPFRDFEIAISLGYLQQLLTNVLQSQPSDHVSLLNITPGPNAACDSVDPDLIQFSASAAIGNVTLPLPVHFAVSLNFGGPNIQVILSHEAHICGLATPPNGALDSLNDALRRVLATFSKPTDVPTNLPGLAQWNGGTVRLLYAHADPNKNHVSIAGRFPRFGSDVVQIDTQLPPSDVGFATPPLMDEIPGQFDAAFRISSGFISKLVTDLIHQKVALPTTEPARGVFQDPQDHTHNVFTFGFLLHHPVSYCNDWAFRLFPISHAGFQCTHFNTLDLSATVSFIARFRIVRNGTSALLCLELADVLGPRVYHRQALPLGNGITNLDWQVDKDSTAIYMKY